MHNASSHDVAKTDQRLMFLHKKALPVSLWQWFNTKGLHFHQRNADAIKYTPQTSNMADANHLFIFTTVGHASHFYMEGRPRMDDDG
jgi:hypothetical protein